MKPYPTKILRRLILTVFLLIALTAAGPLPASQEATTPENTSETAEATPPAYTDEDCIACHQLGAGESALEIPVEDFKASVHGNQITCLDCHTDIVDDTHQETSGSGAVDCAACHEQENDHGMNGAEDARPDCHACHTRHNMLSKTDPASSIHPYNLPATCAGCHPEALPRKDILSRIVTFKINSHTKADFSAAYDIENCVGCHQGAAAHGETNPVDDQNCHLCHGSPEAAGAMWGDMHAKPTTFAAVVYALLVIVALVMILRALLGRVFGRGKCKP